MRTLAVVLGLYLLLQDDDASPGAPPQHDPVQALQSWARHKGGMVREYDPAEAAHIQSRNPPPQPEAGSREWTDYLKGCAKSGLSAASAGLAMGPWGAVIGAGVGCLGSVGFALWDEYG